MTGNNPPRNHCYLPTIYIDALYIFTALYLPLNEYLTCYPRAEVFLLRKYKSFREDLKHTRFLLCDLRQLRKLYNYAKVGTIMPFLYQVFFPLTVSLFSVRLPSHACASAFNWPGKFLHTVFV